MYATSPTSTPCESMDVEDDTGTNLTIVMRNKNNRAVRNVITVLGL